MKKNASSLLLLIAVFSLGVIGTVVATSIFKTGKQMLESPSKSKNVLGELTQSIGSPSSLLNTALVSDVIQNTKDTVSQKTSEVEKTIVKTVEKEIATMTQSQIDAIQLQICTQWGVVTVSPTNKP